MPVYRFDRAMCGSEFEGDLRVVAEHLTQRGYPSEAVTDSYNGAPRESEQSAAGVSIPPESIFLEALSVGDPDRCDKCGNPAVVLIHIRKFGYDFVCPECDGQLLVDN